MKKINIILLRSSPRKSEILLGAEAIILTIAEGIDKNKFNPLILVLKEEDDKIPPLATEARLKGIPVEIITLKGKFDFSSILKLRKLTLKNNIHIIHSNEYKSDMIAFLATRFIHAKLVTTTHGWLLTTARLKFYEFLDSIIIRFFDKIVAVSKAMREELLKIKIPSSRIVVIETALDFSRIQSGKEKTDLKRELSLPSDTVIIGTMGRLSPERGHVHFLKAAKEIIKTFPKVVFIIVGDGDLKEDLMLQAREMGIEDRVFFLGFRKDIANILSSVDIYVSSSLRDSFGIAVVEAMAAGKPVIATKVGIVPEIIKDDETGITIEPGNSNVIYEAATKLLKDDKLRVKLGISAKQVVTQRFSRQQMVGAYEQLYLTLLEK